MVEIILRDWVQIANTADVLRFFNPVGAHISGKIGESPKGIPNNLLPHIAQVAIGRGATLKIFGDDYDTRDGTGERDYIHVTDLANAHVAALNCMSNISGFNIYNIGSGSGTTVRELISAYAKVIKKDLPSKVVARRLGDVACSVASPKKANDALNWTANLTIEDAVSSSWNWQSQNPDGYSAD